MASITLNIPNALIPTLVAAADELLLARNIDPAGMTNNQKAQRYIVEVLKDVYVSRTAGASELTARAAVDAAREQAKTDAGGIV